MFPRYYPNTVQNIHEMIKWASLLIWLIAVPAIMAQQHNYQVRRQLKTEKVKKNLKPEIQRLDSVVGFYYDTQSGSHNPVYLFDYNYRGWKANPYEVVRLILPGRTASNRQLYTYNRDGSAATYIYQEWVAGSWSNVMFTRYNYSSEGNLIHEMFFRPTETGDWVSYQQHFYEYDESGNRLKYLRQMKETDGSWYDFSENFWIYDEAGRLYRRFERRIADTVVIWTETYNYGDGTVPTERIRQNIKYDPVTKQSLLMDDTRDLYYYDIFGNPNLIEQFSWTNDAWHYTGKRVLYYSFKPGCYITICYEGETMTVRPEKAAYYLERGATPGECSGNEAGVVDYQGKSESFSQSPVIVYPNPAYDYFHVQLSPDHPYTTASLYSINGMKMQTLEVLGMTNTIFNTEGLKSGRYILHLAGITANNQVMIIIR